MLGYDLLKGLNVLDLSLNMETLEEQMLHEIVCIECPELESRWQDIKIRALDSYEAVEAAEVPGGPLMCRDELWRGPDMGAEMSVDGWGPREKDSDPWNR